MSDPSDGIHAAQPVWRRGNSTRMTRAEAQSVSEALRGARLSRWYTSCLRNAGLFCSRTPHLGAGKVMEAASRAERVVLGARSTALVLRDPEATGYTLLALLGAAFAVIGLVDLLLLWVPPQFGNPAWEFGTLSQTFDSLPMAGLGLGLLTLGLLRHPRARPRLVRAASVGLALLTLVLVGLGLLYVTAVPAVLKATPVETLDPLGRAVVKNLVEIVVYVAIFAAISTLLWRGVRKETNR